MLVAGLVVAGFWTVSSCSTSRKAHRLRKDSVTAPIGLVEEGLPEVSYRQARRDTLVVQDAEGNDVLIMKAIRDEDTGDMVATETLDAAVVTARFRNVAERRGRVTVRYEITVPGSMQDSHWQIRFLPRMTILGETHNLDPVIITGEDYRKRQLRGYEQYERWLATIVHDEFAFVDISQLEVFLERNLPELFSYKTDSTEVSDDVFYSHYGVSERQAVEHYTNHFRKRRNDRRWAAREKMFRRWVKVPIDEEHIRLDTVIRTYGNDFKYEYVQTFNTRPRLRKVDVVLSGDIWEMDKRIYTMPDSEPLTFYVSSIVSFVDRTDRYLTRVIERRVEASASYPVAFAVGKADVLRDFGGNAAPIAKVEETLTDLLTNDTYGLDSIVVVANASPEGDYEANRALSRRRGESVAAFFRASIDRIRKELSDDAGFSVDEDGAIVHSFGSEPAITMVSRAVPENWDLLDRLVGGDPRLDSLQKARYFSLSDVRNPDLRERRMRDDDAYRYIVDSLYPRLRVVDFTFHLHRKGMVKDTVHTTELDERYARAVDLLADMDYEGALDILSPYQDYNTAVAYLGLERNASALLILERLEKTPQVNYLLAIAYARTGRERDAVECYLRACADDRTYVHRGNLDPEISDLIRLYGLNRQDDIDEYSY